MKPKTEKSERPTTTPKRCPECGSTIDAQQPVVMGHLAFVCEDCTCALDMFI